VTVDRILRRSSCKGERVIKCDVSEVRFAMALNFELILWLYIYECIKSVIRWGNFLGFLVYDYGGDFCIEIVIYRNRASDTSEERMATRRISLGGVKFFLKF